MSPAVSRAELESLLQASFARGALFPLTVTGWSMRPLLRHARDVVLLEDPQKRPPRRGDIVLFRRTAGEWVLHRVISRTAAGSLVMNGDAQTWTELISPEQVRGVASAVRRGRHVFPCSGPLLRFTRGHGSFCARCAAQSLPFPARPGGCSAGKKKPRRPAGLFHRLRKGRTSECTSCFSLSSMPSA